MVGRFILGAIFGGVVVTGGLVIGAALFPPSQDRVAANANAEPEASAPMEAAPPAEVAEPGPEPTAEPAPPPDPTPAVAEEPVLTPEPAPEAADAPSPDTAAAAPAPAETAVTDPAPVSPATTETATAADPSADGSPASAPAPQAPPEPALLAEVAPPAPETAAEAPAPIAEVPAPDQPADPAQPPAPEADGAVAADGPPPPAPAEPAPATMAEASPATEPTPIPAPETAPEPPEADPWTMIVEAQPPVEAPAVDTPEEAAPTDDTPGMATQPDLTDLPGSVASDMPGTRPTGLPGSTIAGAGDDETAPADENGASGVIVGRLPRIGDAPATAEAAPGDVAEAAPADDRPIAQFAAPFENPDNKPLVAILLIDSGADDLDRAGLAALPFPVSFALDPLDPATPDHAAIYRAAGKEVVMLATGLPEGAQPTDVEVAFQSMAQNLPQAVAVMDLPQPAFQNNRPLASLVVPVVQSQGRGLVTWDAGLNAADQVARREDLAATRIFRDLAAGGTDRFAIRRTLERVVFKAGQDGRVAVATAATPEMVAALLEWTIEGRGATVALAPLTAVLTVE